MGTNVDETLAGAGIFHPVEPDAASAPTIGMHGVDVPRPNNFRRHRQDQSPARGLGGPALGLWDRGEERGPPGTPRREGDADGVAEPCSTRPGRRSNHPGAPGCRIRAIFATWTASAPMRSASAALRTASRTRQEHVDDVLGA